MLLRSSFVTALFAFLESEGVRYVVVGDTRDFPYRICSDIDIVIDANAFPKIVSALYRFCSRNRARIVQILRHEQTALYFVCAVRDETGALCFIHPDICSDYLRTGKLLLTADELLKSRTKANRDQAESGSFYVPSSPYSFIYYLLKKIDKMDLRDTHAKYLSAQWERDPSGALSQLHRFWPIPEATVLADAAENNKWSAIYTNLSHLQKTMRRTVPSSFKQLFKECIRRVSRITQPTGVHIVFLGVDGSGKSTIIKQVERDLAPAFRHTKRYHLRPFFGQDTGDGSCVSDPHGKSPRGTFSSLSKLGLWWLDYAVGYLVEVFPRLVCSTLVLFDRYYYDLLVDQKRYRYGGPIWVARFVSKLIPYPDIIILLDAPAEVVYGRKQELPANTVAAQRVAYLELIQSMHNGFVVDATEPLTEVATKVESIILDYLSARTTKRLGVGSVGTLKLAPESNHYNELGGYK